MKRFGFIGLAILLAVIWVIAWLVLEVTGALIHLVLAGAVVAGAMHFFGKRGSG